MNTQTHLSFKVSKRLKEFLGESAPEPMDKMYMSKLEDGRIKMDKWQIAPVGVPAYQLHDLLSKPFCEAMMAKIKPIAYGEAIIDSPWRLGVHLNSRYFYGGLPAVEKALCEMMEAK